MATLWAMDPRKIPFAVAAALLALSHPEPAEAPRPPPGASARPPTTISSSTIAVAAVRLPAVSIAELHCLALNVYFEARGESLDGQMAVAKVTLNRVGATGFPATVCDVVREGRDTGNCQFGWNCRDRREGPGEGPDWDLARAVAFQAMAGARDPTGGALYFQRAAGARVWASHPVGQLVIGRHIFFRVATNAPRHASQGS